MRIKHVTVLVTYEDDTKGTLLDQTVIEGSYSVAYDVDHVHDMDGRSTPVYGGSFRFNLSVRAPLGPQGRDPSRRARRPSRRTPPRPARPRRRG